MVLNIAGFMFIFFYFAYNLDDGAEGCIAFTTESEANEHVLDGKPQHGGYTDVGTTMRGWFGALTVIAGFILALWAGIWLSDSPKAFIDTITGLGNPIGFMHLICWVFLFISRYSFAGEVCSGMYLTAEDYDKDSDIERKYLIDMGMFIKFVWWFWFCIFLLFLIGLSILFIVTMRDVQNRPPRR